MRILFYNPAPAQRRCEPFEALRGSPFFRRPNYDALRLSYLSRNHHFLYVDEHIEAWTDVTPDLVVVHVGLNLADYAAKLIASRWGKEIPTVCYGVYPTLFPDQTRQFCTSAVIGDIASVWTKILTDVRKKNLAPVYEAHHARHFHVDRQMETRFGFTPFFSQVRTSFGCECADEHRDFCAEAVLYRKPARSKIETAAENIARSTRKTVLILDDDFLSDVDLSMHLLERCWRYKKRWMFQTKSTIFERPDLFAKLRDSGVRIIYLKEDWLGPGLNEKIADRAYVKQKEYEVGMVHGNRITIGCRIRLGYPGEDEAFYRRLLKFLVKLRVDILEVSVQTPMPNTATYESFAAAGRVTRDFALYDQWQPVVSIPGISPQSMYSEMERLRDRFYSWDSILQRNIIVSPRLGFYNTFFFYVIPNISYRSNFLEKVGYPP